MANFYNEGLLKELANSPQWHEVDKYIDVRKESLRQKLLNVDPENVSVIALTQGEFRGLTSIQSLVNRYKEV
jgi:hypothetical protein